MPIEVDPAFRSSGLRARQRQRKKRLVRTIAGAILVVGGLMAVGLGWAALRGSGGQQDAGLDDFVMVQTEVAPDEAPSRAPPVQSVDLQTDPMILRLADRDAPALKAVPGPEGFLPDRFGVPASDRFALLTEDLLAAEQRVDLVLPSSREDFALFQAQRSAAAPNAELTAAAAQGPVEAGNLIAVDEESSWGDFIASDGDGPHGDQDGQAVYVETRIQNTTTTVLALRDNQRQPLFDDVVTAVNHARKLSSVLVSSGFSEAVSETLAAATNAELSLPDDLPPGSVVAVRHAPDLDGPKLLQMSVYGPDGYLGSVAQVGPGRVAQSADPWLQDDLLEMTGTLRSAGAAKQDVRLIDALYSTALRNGLSSRMVGEIIVLMSQRFDLDRFASAGDKLTVLFASEPGYEGTGAGQIAYLALTGPSGEMICYVTPVAPDSPDFACFDFEKAPGPGGGGGQLGHGFVVPVKGVKTSGFGPRHHPILKQVRNHNGVDWAAPTGTPVMAAAGGTVSYAGPAGGYGNVIYIDHGGGVQTRYAHLSRFGDKGQKGTRVAAGEVVGYVGTTGRSTGPHLHFEVRVNDKPVDPLTYQRQQVVSAGGQPGSQAVEALVNQIIKVESAGNARAKNPLSSATGLGQFIESTWLRMMRDYRPDLANSMSRAEQLNLRFDPALSREMVRNLAREGEAYLRARGHEITPGNLYLCHFLGAGGAAKALSASRSATVLEVMGSGVVNANPFLRGKTIGDLVAWSDRKMRGSGAAPTIRNAPAAAPVVTVSAEIRAYREAVDAMLEGV
ncbi:peptidoglycan DD-metalloendopeptidase family protein [Tropicibacter alexandrii]|uniref:peptidoglycan DD-metalloendopeptidase family protein n=1 Tax=Tropicibacter alexandrii TaxID=2267683 RepID=UPI000EF4EC53|nr:peptidoglycan DD-metalloendopeptidase family protein [Tropicibacter alexandrii]